MAKHNEENPLFVGVTSGDEVRRSILECSKEILESLKEYEKVKSVRAEKVKLINQFRNDVKGISRSITSLRARLPKVKEIEAK